MDLVFQLPNVYLHVYDFIEAWTSASAVVYVEHMFSFVVWSSHPKGVGAEVDAEVVKEVQGRSVSVRARFPINGDDHKQRFCFLHVLLSE